MLSAHNAECLYQPDTLVVPHRGAIYEYRPIPWLEPPLFLLRNIKWMPPRSANVHKSSELRDAFRRNDRQEYVMASAKRRHIVILSSDLDARQPQMKQVLVAPTYTFGRNQAFRTAVQQDRLPFTFYLATDPSCPGVGECYIDFRKAQPLDKGFLSSGKLAICFTQEAIKAILLRFQRFLGW